MKFLPTTDMWTPHPPPHSDPLTTFGTVDQQPDLPIVEAPGYSRHPTSILAMQLLNAFKCNLKELTTKSAFSAWGQRPLACACPVAGHIDHVIHWRVQFSFVLGSVSHFLPLSPPSRLCWFFSADVFFFFLSVTGACSFPFLWGFMAGLRCCASHGDIISI